MEDLITFQKQRIESLENEVKRLQLELDNYKSQKKPASLNRADPNFDLPLSQLTKTF